MATQGATQETQNAESPEKPLTPVAYLDSLRAERNRLIAEAQAKDIEITSISKMLRAIGTDTFETPPAPAIPGAHPEVINLDVALAVMACLRFIKMPMNAPEVANYLNQWGYRLPNADGSTTVSARGTPSKVADIQAKVSSFFQNDMAKQPSSRLLRRAEERGHYVLK